MTGTVSGLFDVRGDTDWYRVQFEAGKTYQIYLGSGNAHLSLMMPDGTAYDPPVSYTNKITFVAPVSGDYWVKAADSLVQGGTYQISAYEVDDANPGSTSTTLTLGVGETVTQTGPFAADDWYAVDLVAGQSYLVQAGPGNRLYMNDAQGRLLGDVAYGPLHFTAETSGRYYVGVAELGGSSYSVSLAAVADDFGASASLAGTLDFGGTATGVWESKSDSDWFAVNLSAGRSYRFSAVADNPNSWPANIKVVSADGDVLAFNRGTALTTDFSAKTSGIYYVAMTSGTPSPADPSYTVSVEILPITPPPPSTPLNIGDIIAADWQVALESDHYTVNLIDGQSYSFVATSSGGSDSPILMLLDEDGSELTSAFTVNGLTSTLDVGVGRSGTYYLVAKGRDAVAYTLSSSRGPDDYLATSLTTGTITVGGTATGSLEGNGDHDWFAVNLTAHKSYVFTSDSGFANIVVRDAAGNALHDVANGELTVSPAQSGIYYLDVSGDAGDYSVRMFELVGDVAQDMTSRGVIGNVVVGSNTASDTFVSTANHDSFVGLGGDDRFIAGAGYDIYSGGAGFDTVGFTRFKTGAVVDLQRGGTVESGNLKISLASIEHVEGSRFADQIYGSGAAERLVGGRGDDQLFGIDGDDRLFGGLGNDRVEGGAGRDYLDGGDGIDSLSYEHAAAGVVVSLAITGAQNTRGAGVDSVAGFENIRGSAFDDRLTGDDGANVISGLDGADVMIGLGGNDAYYVDNAGDRVVEKAGGGYDTVFAAVDYQLVGDVEALTLTGRSHNDATGNALDNVLTGNSGHNRLNGGAGADRMIGKGGNDIYYVSNAGDVVVEQAGEGHDLVVSTVSFDLRGTHVEDLRMIGSAHINASGDADVNEIRGNAGNNILRGDGGDDLLTGGAGADIFVFDTALGPDIDRITDFSDEGDKIALNPLIFAGIGPAGTLAAGAFQRGRVATEADDRILYDSFYQQVFYDADGNGPGRAVLFAQINHGANLTHSDFMVIG